MLNKSQNSKLKTVRWLFRTRPGFTGRVSLWSCCWHVGSLFRRGLPILPKIKVKFKKNFEFMKTRLLSFRLLLFRQFLSLKLKLTFRSTTQLNIQDLICSREETFARMTDCAMFWVDLCETIPFCSLNDDPTYSSRIAFILSNITRSLPRVSYSRLRKDPLVLLYCLKFSVHTYY